MLYKRTRLRGGSKNDYAPKIKELHNERNDIKMNKCIYSVVHM